MSLDADSLGFELLPADDDDLSPADDLAAAAASALADGVPETPAAVDDAPVPFGRTPVFDFETGRMVRQGGSPAWATGFDALKQWCLMAMYSCRYAHAVFSDEFGVEGLNDSLGAAGAEAYELADDFRQRITDALLIHDRIADVQLTVAYDPVVGVLLIPDLLVTTDEGVELTFDDLQLPLGVEA